MRNLRFLAFFAVAGLASFAAPRRAEACGGDFLPPSETETVTTDHRMILSVSKDQTTLYDQVEYHGSPSSFAWVLPIKGDVTVGLSADVLFTTLDSLTATQVQQPPTQCPPPPTCGTFAGVEGEAADAGASGGRGGGGVTVKSQAQVGPYETVQLHSTDGSALTNWLSSHGYNVPASAAPIVADYVKDQFDFLAMKLVPGKGVHAMRPVRVTSKGASAVLPLRMVAIGTGATTGITLWVVADGRWEPQNFPFFTLTDSEIAWDWSTQSSNYETLRLSKEGALGGKGWQVESSIELNQYSVSNTLTETIDVNGGQGSAYAGTAAQGPTEDLGVLFKGIGGSNARVTRMRTDIAHTALGVDLALQASADQHELSNVYKADTEIGQPLCPLYDGSCNVIGDVPRNQAVAAAQGGGCNASPSRSASSPYTLAALAALVGIAAIRSRRRRA